ENPLTDDRYHYCTRDKLSRVGMNPLETMPDGTDAVV
ncbi:uncharacterized protein METZ01_LOCUS470290, partial [marine metagenome]